MERSTDGSARVRRAPSEWSRPSFTAHLRGPRDPIFADQERMIHEDSLSFRAVDALSRVPGARRVLGAHASDGPDRTGELLHSPLYRRLNGLRYTAAYDRIWRKRLRRVLRRGGATPGAVAASPDRDAATPPASRLAEGRNGSASHAREAPTRAVGSPAVSTSAGRRIDHAIRVLRGAPFEEIQRRGWHFQPNHFYWPLNDLEFLEANPDLWHDRGLPRGIDWDIDGQLGLARVIDGYASELDDVPDNPDASITRFVWNNNAFGGADAYAYYGIVREHRPRRVVEIGSGWSSLVLARALERNGTPTDVTLVEPHPNEELFNLLPHEWHVERAILQHADLALFESLEPGDVCFYDGSHCVRTASDVNWFFFEVLPRLSPGVLIHVHDVFFPDDYHDWWIFDEGLSWNEQYLVQAFLMHNDAYRVRLANHLLFRVRKNDIMALYGCGGGSLWLEKVRER